MPSGVPFLNKTCPFGYTIDGTTGLCTLFNPWTVGAVVLGCSAVGVGLGEAAAHARGFHRNPTASQGALIATSALGAGLAVGLLAKAFMARPLPAASPAPVPSNVVQARRAQDAQRLVRAVSPALVGMAPCEYGCFCISSVTDWCTAGKKFIRPQDVSFMVSFVAPTTAPSQYDFVANVAQWIGFFTYEADPQGDTWCPPTQTFATGTGDCEDLSLLVVSVLNAGGVSASLTIGMFLDPGGAFGHAWVEGVDANGSFLIEATNGKLYRGQRPALYSPSLHVSGGTCAWGSA